MTLFLLQNLAAYLKMIGNATFRCELAQSVANKIKGGHGWDCSGGKPKEETQTPRRLKSLGNWVSITFQKHPPDMIHLFQPVNIIIPRLFRIVFGILGLPDVLNSYIYYHWIVDAYNPEKFQFRYLWLQIGCTAARAFMSILFLSIWPGLAILVIWENGIASAACSLRWATAAVGKSHYLNHGYLFLLDQLRDDLSASSPAILGGCAPARASVSYNPYWCLFLLQFLMG